ncbi:scd2/ral3 [Coprinopsis cinerea okayama7|uniref:Scd2/ral3 n=1 Tax=Coprinopsis cinerea (strain Okayama-7 / 130 / ATCC MYA-4618 / FGSC 9003) TaxID=240176 RepID=A8NYB3_COPC7|nr:scd2/ral3 [Coprinopsis cinerea okayama7\|eukprot:XP_001837385.2 scd2/ral3 [Coprinopsis cinerea okayama7\
MSKPPSAILPPQKVIRANSSYKSQAPQELSFQKGDFFYVLKDAEGSAWYEAHNPVTGARGIVPRAMFEEFGKNAPPVRHSQFSTPGGGGFKSMHLPGSGSAPSPPTPKHQVYYAIVMHDFSAERPDELDAKRGDAITVVAQSNREWFVAKPIGKLGRPGLIPVSFVEIHDPTTGAPIVDVDALIDRGDLPKVEDWKRAMLNYKQNSISLGVIDPPSRGGPPTSPFLSTMAEPMDPPREPEPPRPQTPECLPEGILLSADVVSFHYEMEEYWFRVDAIFQPYSSPGSGQLPPAKQLILFRVYEDFYEFQVTLLRTFPREAGQQPPHPRVLPYMPGPAKDVDDALTATRREELDEYIHGLCALSRSGYRHILEHEVLRQFLALKPGDVDSEIDPRVDEIDALFGEYPEDDYDREYAQEIADQVGRMKVSDSGHHSDGSDYEDEGYAASPQHRPYDRHPYGQTAPVNGRHSREESLRVQAHQNHQRAGSTSSFHTHQTQHTQSYASHSRNHSSERISPISRDSYSNGQSRWTDHTQPTPTTANSFSSASRTRSQTATSVNLNTPPISAANPQTAFVKIKIFDRVADDLIAIRVHPKVSHHELMEKVQARLGSELRVLKYRDSLTNTFVGLDTDEELRAWMEGTDKHVLYAD